MNDYHILLRKLAAARERDISDKTGDELIVELKRVTYRDACDIIDSICSRERMPGNLYAAVKNEIRDKQRYYDRQAYEREAWQAKNDDMVSPAEWRMFWKCLVHILWIDKSGLSQRQQAVMKCDQGFEQQYYDCWQRRVFPPTWSALCDTFLSGYRMACTHDNLLDYLTRFEGELKSMRQQESPTATEAGKNI